MLTYSTSVWRRDAFFSFSCFFTVYFAPGVAPPPIPPMFWDFFSKTLPAEPKMLTKLNSLRSFATISNFISPKITKVFHIFWAFCNSNQFGAWTLVCCQWRQFPKIFKHWKKKSLEQEHHHDTDTKNDVPSVTMSLSAFCLRLANYRWPLHSPRRPPVPWDTG